MPTSTQKVIELLVRAVDNASPVLSNIAANIRQLSTATTQLASGFSGAASASVATATAVGSIGSRVGEAVSGVSKLAGGLTDITTKSFGTLDSLSSSSAKVKLFGELSEQSAISVASFAAQLVVIAGVMAGMLWPAKEAAEFEQVMAKVGVVSESTGDSLLVLTDLARSMGDTTVFSATQAAEGMQLLSMAGLNFKEIMEATPAVLNLAVAGMMSVAQAADISTQTMYGFGKEVTDLNAIIDTLVKTANATNSSVESLGVAMSYAAPIAAMVGADFDELASAIGLMSNAGLQGTRAGTALTGAIDALFNPTRQASEALDALGKRIGQSTIYVTDAEGGFIGFDAILKQLEDSGMTAGEALEIFGRRAGPGMAALVKQGSDALELLTAQTKAAEGTAAEVAAALQDTLSGATQKLGASVKNLAITIGEGLIPSLKWIVDQITIVVKSIDDWARENPVLSSTLTVLLTGIGLGIAIFSAFGLVARYVATSLVGELAIALATSAAQWIAYAAEVGIVNTVLTATVLTIDAVGAALKFLFTTPQGRILTAIVSLGAYLLYTGTSAERATSQFDRLFTELDSGVNASKRFQAQLAVLQEQQERGVDVTKEYNELIRQIGEKFGDSVADIDLASASFETINTRLKEIEQTKADQELQILSERLTRLTSDLTDNVSVWESAKKVLVGGFAEAISDVLNPSLRSLEQVLADAGRELDFTITNFQKAAKASADTNKQLDDMKKVMDDVRTVFINAGGSVEDYVAFLSQIPGMTDAMIEKNAENYESQLALNKALKEAVNNIQATETAYSDAQKQASASIKAQKEELESLGATIDQDVAEGLKTVQDAEEEKYQAVKESLEAQSEIAEEAYNRAVELGDKGVADQEKWSAEIFNIQKQLTENEISELERRTQAEKEAREASISEYKSYMDRRLYELSQDVKNEVITEKEANSEKLQMELDYLAQISDARDADFAKAQENYDSDSAGYAKALSAKESAELAYQKKLDETLQQESDSFDDLANHMMESTEAHANTLAGWVSAQIDATAKIVASVNEMTMTYSDAREKLSMAMSDIGKNITSADWIGALSFMTSQFREMADAFGGLTIAMDTVSRVAKSTMGVVFDLSNMSFKDLVAEVGNLVKAWDGLYDSMKKSSERITAMNADIKTWKEGVGDSVSKLKDFQDALNTFNSAYSKLFSGDIVDSSGILGQIGLVSTSYDDLVNTGEATISALKAQWDDLANKIDEINQKIKDIYKETDDTIRELERNLMSDEQAWLDIRQEAHEKMNDAVKAMNAGNVEEANALFDESRNLAKSLAKEVKNSNGEVVTSLQEATTESVSMLKQIEQAQVSGLSTFRDTLTVEQNAIGDTMESVLVKLNDTLNKLAEILSKTQAIKSAIGGTVIVSQAEQDYWKQYWEAYNKGLPTPTPPTFGEGGIIRGRLHSQGGQLINVEGGEGIISRDDTAYYGEDVIHALNTRSIPRAIIQAILSLRSVPEIFKDGGIVGSARRIISGLYNIPQYASGGIAEGVDLSGLFSLPVSGTLLQTIENGPVTTVKQENYKIDVNRPFISSQGETDSIIRAINQRKARFGEL